MEEKIVRTLALTVTMLAVFICSSLYYLPALQTRAWDYFEDQQLEQEKEERQKMWSQLSGLDFLDYSTRQARIDTANSSVTGDESLDLKGQLRMELPEGCSRDAVTIENDYVKRTVRIYLPGAAQNYLVEYPMIGSSDHIEDLSYDTDENGGVLELSMEHVYELSLDWDGQYLYIDFVLPSELYDHIVVIDAGHGGGMPGAIIDGVEEKDIDLAIVKRCKTLFDRMDDESIGIYYTRLDDSNPSFEERVNLSNDLGADLFISIHNNSYPADSSVHGTAVLYDEKGKTSARSKQLAELLLQQTTEALSTKSMGLVKGNDIYVIRATDAPAALLEVGFMTNKQELSDLQEKSYQKKCARAVWETVLQALKGGNE